MITNKKDLKFYISADLMMNFGKTHVSFKQRIESLLKINKLPIFFIILRKYEYAVNNKSFMRHFYRIKYKRISNFLGFSIALNVFDYGLVIPHFGTIVVGPNNKIGKYCVLHTSTCITESVGQPRIIGDSFYLSSGSVIAKNHYIGDNITVSACSFVNKDIKENNVLLGGQPSTILKNKIVWYSELKPYINRVNYIEKIKNENFN